LLALVTTLTSICPLTDAGLAYVVNWPPTRFAAEHGLAVSLTSALRTFHDHRPGSWRRSLPRT